MNKTVYIIMYTTGIGGAEKRFSELWLNFQKLGYENIKLVLPKELYNNLVKNSQLQNIQKYKQNIIFIERTNKSYLFKRKILVDFINIHNKSNAVFHFILMFPIFSTYSSKYNTVFTYPATSFKALSIKALFTTLFTFIEANKIDILDPRLTDKSKLLFFYYKNKLFNTPGSFIDTKYYTSTSVEKKKNWLVFLGRFEDVKQVVKYLKTIPYIDKILKKNNINNHEFFILGEGSLEQEMKNYINSIKEFRNIKIHIYFEKDPINILSKSKIFFSLQKYSNYPSKSLLEAIACGNLPIVTDNGDTRKIAHNSFSYYVNEDFSEEEIANKCVKILSIGNEKFLLKNKVGKQYIEENFNINKNIEYFLNLYDMKIKND